MDDATSRPTDGRSLPELISQLATDLSVLVRKETELVRTEVSEKVHAATLALGEVVAGGVFLIAALLVLLQALVLAISKAFGIETLWSSLIVGVLVALAGYLLVRGGLRTMSPKNLKPDRATRQLAKDAQFIKGH